MSRLRRSALAASIAAAVVTGSSAVSAATSKLAYEDTVKPGESSSVTVVVRSPAAFSVNLKAPSAGRTRLFLEGSGAPKGGALIDTKTARCQGAAGTLSCSGAYEPLPKGSYRFRMTFSGGAAAHLRLTVRW